MMMYKSEEDFLRELLEDFKVEGAEHLQAVNDGLLALEKNLPHQVDKAVLESVFREVHSMKGAARAVNLTQIEQLCMSLESIFHAFKDGTLVIRGHMFDHFYKATDLLQELLRAIDDQDKEISPADVVRLSHEIEGLNPMTGQQGFNKKDEKDTRPFHADSQRPLYEDTYTVEGGGAEPAETTSVSADESSNHSKPGNHKITDETVRVSTGKLTALLHQAEALISVKTALAHQLRELSELDAVEQHARREVIGALQDQHRQMERLVDDLLVMVKKTLLYPFSTLLNMIPRIARDLAKEYGKTVHCTIKGGETEIDRRILEEMKDPLIHIIRNSIDHGIETQKVRRASNKPEAGLLEVDVSLDADQKVIINIMDDGAGIDKQKLVDAAVKAGIVDSKASREMSDEAVHMLLFQSGVSTSPYITDVSGRGLGMAIVAEKVAVLGGTIDVRTKPGQGSTFSITLPQTMAQYRGLLVSVADQQFLLQTTSIVKVLRISSGDIQTVESRNVIHYQDETIALVSLAEVLQLPARSHHNKGSVYRQVVILRSAQKKVAFLVDDILDEHEGVVKNLGSQLKNVPHIAGAVILGNGKLVPVLHVTQLLQSSFRYGMASKAIPVDEGKQQEAGGARAHVLVVEDSITVRNVLKNLVEGAGYRVSTAVDGLAGYELLKKEAADLVVSDVDMPRMNGFELCAKIREDQQLADTPVLLVTALESAEDRQRGLEAGANAYIRKGIFDKGNLIETISRLI